MPLKPVKASKLWYSPSMAAAKRIPEIHRCKTCDYFAQKGPNGVCMIRYYFSTDAKASCLSHTSLGEKNENSKIPIRFM